MSYLWSLGQALVADNEQRLTKAIDHKEDVNDYRKCQLRSYDTNCLPENNGLVGHVIVKKGRGPEGPFSEYMFFVRITGL